MPGKTPREAVAAYADPIKKSLACVTKDVLSYFGGVYQAEKTHNLCFVGDPPLAALNGTKLKLFFSQNYKIVQTSSGDQQWRVSTTGYIYRLDDEKGKEILAYHWHPTQKHKFPHLHFSQGSGVSRSEIHRAHIPSGRVAIETFVQFLIDDFKVQPLLPDWRTIVGENLERFTTHRTWA